MKNPSLDQQLRKAHVDKNHAALVVLYTKVANECERSGDIDAACFYLTHAYVFALQEGMRETKELHQQLVKYGREQ